MTDSGDEFIHDGGTKTWILNLLDITTDVVKIYICHILHWVLLVALECLSSTAYYFLDSWVRITLDFNRSFW